MTRLGSSTSTMITRVEKGLLLLILVISIGGIGALTVYHVRYPSPDEYAISGGSGELWLTLIAFGALAGFLIVFSEEQLKKNGQIGKQRGTPP